jgi:hypothetical protein
VGKGDYREMERLWDEEIFCQIKLCSTLVFKKGEKRTGMKPPRFKKAEKCGSNS